jgi:translation initiation factor IF-3
VSREEALRKAEGEELDLVEVAVNDGIAVVKIMDYAKFRFEQVKKAKEAKKKQRVIHVKEVKIRPGIDDHDYQHKIKHARSFIEKGDKVKFTMMFRGREIVHTDIGMDLMRRIEEELSDCTAVEKSPSLEGKNITMILTPGGAGSNKKK